MMKKCCCQKCPFPLPDRENFVAWVLMGGLIVAGVGAVVAVWMMKRRRRMTLVPVADSGPGYQPVSMPEPVLPEAEVPPEPEPTAEVVPDDLTRIEGIGPKISGVLQAAGITTFGQLADTEVDQLQQVLRDANVRLAHPGTWPEQAALAAAGQWEQLAALQSTLKGGRRVS